MKSIDMQARICGVDEVGRGCLAGPVIAAAVILPKDFDIRLKDSKKIRPKKRQALAELIKNRAIYGIGRAEVPEIEQFNILQATLLAMQRAVQSLPQPPDQVWIDGIHRPMLPYTMITAIKGDEYIPCISAASILAKVIRDDEMAVWDRIYAGYGFAQNKGYPTPQHKRALKQKGICPLHRQNFKPIRLPPTE